MARTAHACDDDSAKAARTSLVKRILAGSMTSAQLASVTPPAHRAFQLPAGTAALPAQPVGVHTGSDAAADMQPAPTPVVSEHPSAAANEAAAAISAKDAALAPSTADPAAALGAPPSAPAPPEAGTADAPATAPAAASAAEAALAAIRGGAHHADAAKRAGKVTVVETRRFAGQDVQIAREVAAGTKQAESAVQRAAAANADTGIDAVLHSIHGAILAVVVPRMSVWGASRGTRSVLRPVASMHQETKRVHARAQAAPSPHAGPRKANVMDKTADDWKGFKTTNSHVQARARRLAAHAACPSHACCRSACTAPCFALM